MTRNALILASVAFGVWALAFLLLYSGLSLGCAYGWASLSLRLALIAMFGTALVVGVLLLRYARLQGGPAKIAAIAALASSLFTFWPVATLSICE